MRKPFRFGLQVGPLAPDELRTTAKQAESVGFSVISTADHVSPGGYSALLPLALAAEATTALRLCPLVLNNDFHHPVHLARELATLDHLSGGRMELGIGAGHAFTEYQAIGQPFDPPEVRKARLAEAVEALRRLLTGEEVTYVGEHYQLTNVQVKASLQSHMPFLVAVNGKQALAHAAVHADIIGLFGLGRTLADGHRHEARWQANRLDHTVAYIRERAGARADELELNALVQRVVVTDDRKAAAEEIVSQVEGLSVEDALETPYLMLGTHEQMVEHVLKCRERWGISYFTVRDVNAVAPVIERLSAVESRSP